MSNMTKSTASEDYELNNSNFENSGQVADENKKAVSDFANKCYAEGLSERRVKKYISNFHTVLKIADKSFRLLDSERNEIEKIVARIERSDYSEWSKCDLKTALKKFYKVMEGRGKKYPDKVDFISTTADKNKIDLPDPLSKDQIEEIIQACNNDRDRAMYKVLYEAGLRSGELMALRVKDVNFNSKGVKLNVRGKTGNRKLLVVESERYLRNWLSKHPFSDKRNCSLWLKVDGRNIEEKNPQKMEINYDYMRINLKRKAVKAGVRVKENDNGNKTSEIYPHLFRHSRATHLATKMTEAAMKEYFGWTQNSDMPQTYIHLSGRDIDKEIMKIYGLEEEEDKVEKRTCPRCFKTYKGNDNFCPRCGAPLNQEDLNKVEEVSKEGENIIEKKLKGMDEEEIIRTLKGLLDQ